MDDRKRRIGFIGLGNMGTAIYKGLSHDFEKCAYDPYPRKDEGLEYKETLRELELTSDILLVAVKPNKVECVLKQLRESRTIISIAAGISWNQLKEWSPIGSKIIRTMPNLPLVAKHGALGYFGDSDAYDLVEEIFSPMGRTLNVDKESLLDAVTGLSGSGPAFVFSFIQSLAEGGVKSGLSYKDSLDLAITTVLGSVYYLKDERENNPNIHPHELRNRVTSPGGTTIFGLSEWEKNSVGYGISESVFQAYLRSKELG
jgi:pyrroline-5-carboxylate reductase